MTEESCRGCRHWEVMRSKRKKASSGLCRQWAPWHYGGKHWPSPGHFIFTGGGEWCARFRPLDDEKETATGAADDSAKTTDC